MHTLTIERYDMGSDSFQGLIVSGDQLPYVVQIPADVLPFIAGHFDEPDEFVGKRFELEL